MGMKFWRVSTKINLRTQYLDHPLISKIYILNWENIRIDVVIKNT